MLSRVVDVAREATKNFENINILVATEDQRIKDHADEIGAPCVLTSEDCKTGSDRALEAIKTLNERPDFVINLQGDAPFTPPSVIQDLIKTFLEHPETSVLTPVYQLSWNELDTLREAKKTTPFSGTTAIVDENGLAKWFSKTIIPAIRKEDRSQELSPMLQHIGLYGFRTDILEQFCALPQGQYEQLEGLEQLRLLENNIPIQTIRASGNALQAGIDTPEDLKRAEEFLKS